MKNRSAFTLVELLVVITILVVLVGITAATMNWSATKDRIPGAANDTASFIMGARDRAIFQRRDVGVRLLLDENGVTNGAGNPCTATSMIYVGETPPVTGTVSIEWDPDDTDNHLKRLRFWSPGSDNLPGDAGFDDDSDGTTDDTSEFGEGGLANDVELFEDRAQFQKYESIGLLANVGNVIELSNGGSTALRFTLQKSGSGDWLLTSDFPAGNVSGCMDLDYKLHLKPAVLPNEEPRELPRGLAIDLQAMVQSGALPGSWYNGPQMRFNPSEMNLLFSPRGTGVGDWSGFGQLHMLIAPVEDIERSALSYAGVDPFYKLTDRPNAEQERVVTANPRSGRIAVSPLDATDANGDGFPDDPFRLAETGK